MQQHNASWRPSTTLATLRSRNKVFRQIRDFFESRSVLEVETPILSHAATVDRHLESLRTEDGLWLGTSPEFAMKRLLAAGSGPIFQIGRVFRADECGRLHNPEFTLLEWYRPQWDMEALMDEVEALMRALDPTLPAFARRRYRDLFRDELGVDPFDDEVERIREALGAKIALPEGDPADRNDRDFWLDLAMGAFLGPLLGRNAPEFVYDYPASQAALARISSTDLRAAKRFELYWRGIELANGYHELADAEEQRRRFIADQEWRRGRGLRVPPYDAHLVDALAAGFPDCSGVALGLDRLIMLLLNLPSVSAAMAFDYRRA
jgi:lysyl-tRNA synthetase class 2